MIEITYLKFFILLAIIFFIARYMAYEKWWHKFLTGNLD